MKSKAEDLINLGVQKKREGDYHGAKKLYLKAIEIDKVNPFGYYSLAKISYILEERESAVINYLRTLHLSLYYRWQNSAKESLDISSSVDPEFKEFLLHKSPAAVFLPFEANLNIHLAHALVDLDDSILMLIHEALFRGQGSAQSLKFMQLNIIEYRNSILGYSHSVDEGLEDRTYWRLGIGYSIDIICWEKISNIKNIKNIYKETMDIPHPIASMR